MRKFECCDNCKYLYPLERFVDRGWEYYKVCLVLPMTQKKDDNCFALMVNEPKDSMCEMFALQEEVKE